MLDRMSLRYAIALLTFALGNGDVTCGSQQKAASCSQCPPSENPKQVWKWCTGDCVWDERAKSCGDKTTGEHHYHERLAKENAEHGVPEPQARLVSCGEESAQTCGACPPSADASQVWKWCSGDCVWDEEHKLCGSRSPHKLHDGMRDAEGYLPSKAPPAAGTTVSCGKQQAASCGQCPLSADAKEVWKWCSGDCVWNEKDRMCIGRAKSRHQTKMPTDKEGHINAAEL